MAADGGGGATTARGGLPSFATSNAADVRGITNEGNSCFLSALMQAISASPSMLRHVFDSNGPPAAGSRHDHLRTAMKRLMAPAAPYGPVLAHVTAVTCSLWLPHGLQHDVHEALSCLVHDVGGSFPAPVPAPVLWTKDPPSFFETASASQCAVCAALTNEVADGANALTVTPPLLAPNTAINILVECYFEPVDVFCHCWRCGVDTMHKKYLWAPHGMKNLLVVHANLWSDPNGNKVMAHPLVVPGATVAFHVPSAGPLPNVYPQPAPAVRQHQYSLCSAVLHAGADVNSGHYTAALCRSSNPARWLYADDGSVFDVPTSSALHIGHTVTPYLWFFEAVAVPPAPPTPAFDPASEM